MWSFAAAIGGGIVLCLWAGYRAVTIDLRLKRRVRRAQSVKIAEARDGAWVKVVGTVSAAEASDARRVVYSYRWREELVAHGIPGGGETERWVDAGQEARACDFWLEDSSGRALVKLVDVEPVPLFDASQYKSFQTDSARGQELAVRVGDHITVCGSISRYSTPRGGPFRGSGADATWITSGTSKKPIVLTS